jgi:aminoglycoside phosphotransferase (APT) family kinase protein
MAEVDPAISVAGDGVPELGPILPNHRFDEAALARHLRAHLPDFRGDLVVRQFQGGQSNPTFHLRVGDREYVLRKQPPGKLLPSAHAVDREYRVIRALAETEVPVPRVYLLCTDESVIGRMFYIMDYVPGRVFAADRTLPSLPPAERARMYDDMNRVLAALHRVDWRAVGLEGFGRPENYFARQIARWSKQYEASRTEDVPAMDHLVHRLGEHAPPSDEAAIVHGDFRLGNLLFHPSEPRVAAVLDWELSTIGHPLADLGYNLLTYHLPASAGGVPEAEMLARGLPSQADYVAAYCRRTGRAGVPDLGFVIVFAMFRLAAIVAGVYRRALDGNAADARARARGAMFREIADRAWLIAEAAERG